MSCDPAIVSDAELIGRLVDGPSDPAVERELARRITADPALGRLLRRHLMIAELAEARAVPERGAEAFAAGWQVRVAAEADAAVFTARTMLRIVADRADCRTEWLVLGLRAAGLAAAASLLFCLGWGASSIIDAGRRWYNASALATLDTPAVIERGEVIRSLREAQP